MPDINDMTPAERMAIRDKALWMALDGRAKSREAQGLVRSIMATYVAELAPERMQRRRDRLSAVHASIEALMCGVLGAANVERWAKCSMRSGDFTGQRVGYRTFALVVRTLAGAGLMDKLNGFADRSGFGPTGKVTCLRLTDAGMALVLQHGIDPTFHTHHFSAEADRKAPVTEALSL